MLNVPQPNWLESQEFREVLSQVINELLNTKLTKFIIQREKEVTNISILERILRGEEELKTLREFQEKQFEAILSEMNARFEAMNARFEALEKEMNTRFEALEKRFNHMQWFVGVCFTTLSILIGLFFFAGELCPLFLINFWGWLTFIEHPREQIDKFH